MHSVNTKSKPMVKPRLHTLSVFCLLAFALAGCSRTSVPNGILSESRMVDFLEQAYFIEGYYAIETGYQYDTLHPQMLASYDSLLASCGITREEFERSVDWYTHHTDRYERLYDSVLARFDSRLAEE